MVVTSSCFVFRALTRKHKFEKCSSSKLDNFTLFTHSFVGWNIRILESIFLQNKNWLRVQDFVDKTFRVVRISLLISAIQRVLSFFLGKLFYKSNRKLFSWVCIAWYKHSRRWENSRQLCKPPTSSPVCIIVSNSPNPSRVYVRLCKHGKRFLLLEWCWSYVKGL